MKGTDTPSPTADLHAQPRPERPDRAQIPFRLARVMREVRIHGDRVEIEPRPGETAMLFSRTQRRVHASRYVEPRTRED
jgi:hypothetical protein